MAPPAYETFKQVTRYWPIPGFDEPGLQRGMRGLVAALALVFLVWHLQVHVQSLNDETHKRAAYRVELGRKGKGSSGRVSARNNQPRWPSTVIDRLRSLVIV